MKHLFKLFILLFLPLSLSAQTMDEKDSLSLLIQELPEKELGEIYYNLSMELRRTWPDSALQYASKAEVIFLSDDPDKRLPWVYKSKAHIYAFLMATERSLLYYKKAYDEFIKMGNDEQVGDCALRLGNQLYDLANYGEAYFYYMQSLHAFEEAGDVLGIARMQNNLGIVSHDMGRTEEAEQHYQNAYDRYMDAGQSSEACGALGNLGLIYYDRELYDTALSVFFQVCDILDPDSLQNSTEIYILAGIYHNIASAYSETGRYSASMEYYRKSLQLALKAGDPYSEGSVYVNIGGLFREMQQQDSALFYLHRALRIGNKRDYRSLILDVYEELAKLHASTGSYASAYNWQVRYDTLYKSLFNANQSEQIAQLRTRYEQELKEKDIIQLRSEKHVQKTVNIITLAFLLVVVVLIVIITRNLTANKRTNAELAERNSQLSNTLQKLSDSELELQKLNQSKDRIFSVVAHDLRNPVAGITGFSELLYDNYDSFEDATRKEYVMQIQQGTQRIQNMLENLLIWARSQMKSIKYEPELLKMKTVLEDCVRESKSNLDHKKVECIVQIESKCSVSADRSMINTVFRNLLANAIKFSFPGGKIIITSRATKDNCMILISDQGIGIQPEIQEKLFTPNELHSTPGTTGETGSGLGLVICKEFLEKNNGQIRVESEPGNGSTFIVTLPVQ